MSYFRFHIYKAIRKVVLLPIVTIRSYKGLILVLSEPSRIEKTILPQVIKTTV